MEATQVTSEGSKRLKRLGLTLDPSLNALSVAFQSACMKLDPEAQDALDEPGLTTMFLGVLREAADSCGEEFGADGSPGCTWVHYSAQGPLLTEPRTGADFALVVRLGAGVSRLAIFQAKKGTSDTPMVLQVHRMAPKTEGRTPDEPNFPEEPQFTRLVRHGLGLLGRESSARADLSPLPWVHYLAYNRRMPAETFSIDQMATVRDEYARRTDENMNRANSISLKAMTGTEFRNMLRDAVELPYDPARELDGWMDVRDEEVQARLVKLAKHLDVFVGRDRTAGPVPELLPKPMIERAHILSTPGKFLPPLLPATEVKSAVKLGGKARGRRSTLRPGGIK